MKLRRIVAFIALFAAIPIIGMASYVAMTVLKLKSRSAVDLKNHPVRQMDYWINGIRKSRLRFKPFNKNSR